MLRRVVLVRIDVSEERIASIIRVRRIGELGTTLRSILRLLVTANVVPSSPILVTLMMEATLSFETLVLTRATGRNIPEDGIFLGVGCTARSFHVPRSGGGKVVRTNGGK
jgi:hypothetical protein